MLAHEADFNDRAPTADDSVGIGVVNLAEGCRFERIATTLAWNWQQGAMLQWHPTDPERLFFHNDRRDGRFVCVVRDIMGAERRVYDRPVYAVLPDGETAFSVNFSRLARHRPGYGYVGCVDPLSDDRAPDGDGIWRLDLASGKANLIVSLAELASRDVKLSMVDAFHYINHVQISRGGKRVAFFHIWCASEDGLEVRLYTCRPDGSDLRCLLDTGDVSHYDWYGDEAILVWAVPPDQGNPRFLFVPIDGVLSPFSTDVLTEDGHCSFSPDRKWVLNDTYPDTFGMRTLMLVSWPTGRRVDLARLYSPKSRWWGEIRCDLHPRWSRDGRQVCLDSVHEGTRQIYVVDLAQVGL